MESIKNLIQDQVNTLTRHGLGRLKYSPYNMDVAMEVVSRIRKGIEPKFVTTPKIDDLYKRLIQWFHADEGFPGDIEKGFIIQGPTGTGKTLAMQVMSIYRTIDDIKFTKDRKVHRMNYEIINTSDLAQKFIANSFEGIYEHTVRYVLCLDDIGGEIDQVKHYGNTLDVIGHIISERYTKRLLTFGTTNLTTDMLDERYGERVTSRMHAIFNFIEMNGSDYRKKPIK